MNNDDGGHRLTVEIERKTGAILKKQEYWVDANTVETLEKIGYLLKGQKYRVYIDSPRGQTLLKEGKIDETRDSAIVIISKEKRLDKIPVDDLAQFASFLEVGDKTDNDIISKVDLLGRLGSIIVATKNNDGYEYHAIIPLSEVYPVLRDNYNSRKNTVTSHSALAALSGNAIFATVRMGASYADYYSMSWDLTKNWYANNFDVQGALIGADQISIQSIYQALYLNENANVYVISRFSAIENMTFTVSEGRRVSADMNLSVGFFIRADGNYMFDHRDEEIIKINNLVVSVTPALVASRTFMIDYLKSRLDGSPRGLDLGRHSDLNHDSGSFVKGLGRYAAATEE